MPVTRRKVLIFRSELLPRSEVFIAEQARSMRSFQPVFGGIKRLPRERSLGAEPAITVCESNALRDKLRRRLFTETGVAPDFFSRVAGVAPAVIHAHFAVDGSLALPVQKRLGVPLVVTLHGYDVTRGDRSLRRTPLGRVYCRRRSELFRRASLFLCVSEFIYRKALERGFPEEKLWVHRIGVDLQSFGPPAARSPEPLILFVGRLVENKGCAHLIRAMELVEEKVPEARLVIAGDGPLRSSLEADAGSRLRRFTFLGMQTHQQVRGWMERARMLAMPSVAVPAGDSEGLGMAMCEAQAMGVPGVGFRGTGVEEALSDGETGLLAAPGDERALGEAIVRLLSDDSLAARMSVAARGRAERLFDLEMQTALLEEKYDEVLRG